jgi:hypothetical protein
MTELKRTASRGNQNVKPWSPEVREARQQLFARGAPVQIPDAVLAERDRRLAADRTINMLLLGDPLPGRSALDRRGQHGHRDGGDQHQPRRRGKRATRHVTLSRAAAACAPQ